MLEETLDPARKVAFLRAHGAGDQAHSDADLLTHLLGTRDLLEGWGAPPAVYDAGLFHSVYGTDSRPEALISLDLRGGVQEVIGVEAEEIAYCFGAIRQATLYSNLEKVERFTWNDRFSGKWRFLSEQRLRELCDLTVANWLEQRPRLPPVMRESLPTQIRRMAPWISPRARDALLYV